MSIDNKSKAALLAEVLHHLIDASLYNATVIHQVGRRAGVDVPFDPNTMNSHIADLRARVRLIFSDDESPCGDPEDGG